MLHKNNWFIKFVELDYWNYWIFKISFKKYVINGELKNDSVDSIVMVMRIFKYLNKSLNSILTLFWLSNVQQFSFNYSTKDANKIKIDVNKSPFKIIVYDCSEEF